MTICALDDNDTSSRSDHTGCESLANINLQILEQLETSLSILTQTQYADSSDQSISSIGKHTRHIIEFYQALFKVIQEAGRSELCYDNRQRNTVLETSKESALQELNTIRSSLASCSACDTDIQLASIIDPDKPMFVMKTTLKRELFYLLDHTIHHMALIKILAEKQSIHFEQGFGLAQSTKAYEDSKG